MSSGNACYYTARVLLSSFLLQIRVKMCSSITGVFHMVSELVSLLREEHSLRVDEKEGAEEDIWA
jgi:DNA primase large subunit